MRRDITDRNKDKTYNDNNYHFDHVDQTGNDA